MLSAGTEGVQYHVPCLVELSTEEVGGPAIYTLRSRLLGEIAPEENQQSGTLIFFSCAGLHGTQVTFSYASCPENFMFG